jgi:hypothetical protein
METKRQNANSLEEEHEEEEDEYKKYTTEVIETHLIERESTN